eukprot:c47684_g1_i1 orf=1-528(-)
MLIFKYTIVSLPPLVSADCYSSSLSSTVAPSPVSSVSISLSWPRTANSASSLAATDSLCLLFGSSCNQVSLNFSPTRWGWQSCEISTGTTSRLSCYRCDTSPSISDWDRGKVGESKGRKLFPIIASSMKKIGSGRNMMTSADVASPGGNKAHTNLGVGASISVSQTERETIVHTNS